MFESMMEWKGFELEGDSLRDSFASRTSKIFKAGDRRRLYKSEGEKVRSRASCSYNPFAVLPDADRELLLDALQLDERQFRG
jgi:hypothetical protein